MPFRDPHDEYPDEPVADGAGSEESARAEEPVWLEDGESEADTGKTPVVVPNPAPVPVQVQVQVPPKIPGPGVFESFGWLVGVIGVHLVATAIVVVVIALMVVGLSGDRELTRNPERLQLAVTEHIGVVMAGDQFLFVMVVLVAVGLRLSIPSDPSSGPWSRLCNRLGRQRLSWPHALAIVLVVIPVSLSCGQLYVMANRVWRSMLEAMPGLPDVKSVQEVNIISGLAESLPLPILVIVLAVLPAIGEELVFRGVIGRGLVARCGVVQGIFVTSLLFAVAHLHPAHQISVFPLGVLLHVIYLATRSILAPILLHFLVNSWAAVLAKASLGMKGEGEGAELLMGDDLMAWYVLLPAVVGSLSAIGFFWRSRIEFRDSSGNWWWPSYRSVETPSGPSESTRLKPPPILVVVFCAALLCFYVSAGWEISRLSNGG
jgi:membrane protease YdiL (CAAX protease family)